MLHSNIQLGIPPGILDQLQDAVKAKRQLLPNIGASLAVEHQRPLRPLWVFLCRSSAMRALSSFLRLIDNHSVNAEVNVMPFAHMIHRSWSPN